GPGQGAAHRVAGVDHVVAAEGVLDLVGEVDRVVDLCGVHAGALRDHRGDVLAGVAGIGNRVVAAAIGVDAGQHAVAVLQVRIDAGLGQFAVAQPSPAGGTAAAG